MATVAVEVINQNIAPAGHGHAIVLVVHVHIPQRHGVGAAHVEAVSVVRCGEPIADVIGRVAGGVVKIEVFHCESMSAGDVEAVRGPVLDVQAGDLHVVGVFDYPEVVGPVGERSVLVLLLGR